MYLETTHLMKLAKANQPRHTIPNLELIKADHTFNLVPLVVDAILFRRRVHNHPACGKVHASPIPARALAVPFVRGGGGVMAPARAAHAPGALGG